MKHCKTCEKCCVDPITAYLRGFDYYNCALDGHHIEEPFWEKCDKFVRDKDKTDKTRSFLYYIVESVRECNAKKKH